MRDPRIRYVTELKVRALQKRIDALIRADVDAYERAELARIRAAAAGAPAPRIKPNGFPDRRSRGWKAVAPADQPE